MSVNKSKKGWVVSLDNGGKVLIRGGHDLSHAEAVNLVKDGYGSYIAALAKNGNPGVDPGFKVLLRSA
jgi:hypothetical protein